MSGEQGPLVIAYAQDGRERHAGVPDEAVLPFAVLVAELEKADCQVLEVFDGIARAREDFPQRSRVEVPRKWWGTKLATVQGGYQVTATGVHVDLVFDDGWATDWWASGLVPVTGLLKWPWPSVTSRPATRTGGPR